MALVISQANQTSGTEVEDDAVLIGANRVKGGSGPFAEVYSEDLELEFERMVKRERCRGLSWTPAERWCRALTSH